MPSRPLPLPVIYVGSERGAPPVVKAYDAETGKLNFERTVFESTFTGGVRVATADFTGDGFPDLAVGAGEGGSPRVRILDGKSGNEIAGPLGNFFAFEEFPRTSLWSRFVPARLTAARSVGRQSVMLRLLTG